MSEATEIRKLSRQNKSLRLTIPPAYGWQEGDQVAFHYVDENNLHIQRLPVIALRQGIAAIFPTLSEMEQKLETARFDKLMDEEYEHDLKMNDGGISYYTNYMCQMCTKSDETLSCEYMKNFEVSKWNESDDHTELLNALNLCRTEQGYEGDYKAEKYEKLKKDWRW